MRRFKYIFVAILASVMISPLAALSPASAHYGVDELSSLGFAKAASNKNLELYYNKQSVIFAVRVKSSGYVWYSSPLGWEDDENASGFAKNAMGSLFSIRAKDNKSTFRTANSIVNVVRRKGLSMTKIDNGIRLDHTFVREGIYIPLDITLDDNSLVMSVNIYEITEDEDTESQLKLMDFEIAPYFGAAPSDEDGFIFVPDGSGAVIRFNNQRTGTTYQQYVYGRDKSIVPPRYKDVTQNIFLPVFGLSREGAGFIGVFESGDARGIINAESSGQLTDYNAVSSSFIVRDFDSVSFRERTGTPREVKIYERQDFEKKDDVYAVRYIFLDEQDNNLAGMAKAYRSYLQDNGLFPEESIDNEESALVINFIGSSVKKKAVAGIPSNVEVPFTTFKEARSFIERLQDMGVSNFIVKFDGWTKNGVLSSYPSKAKASSALGGNREMKKLLEYLDEQGIPFYAGVDFVNLYQSDASHIPELTANRMINRSPVKIPDYRLSTYTTENEDAYPYWILRAAYVSKGFNRFFDSFVKRFPGSGIALDSLGNVLGSDFDIESTDRLATEREFISLLDRASSSAGVYMSQPFAYALPYVSYAADLPTTSSRFDVEDFSVPFYQMVLQGFIPYSNISANRSTSLDSYKLHLIETGADVSMLWIAKNTKNLRDSRMQWLIDTYGEDWIDDAASLYEEVSAVTSLVKGQPIVGYEAEGDIRRTRFANGVTVTVDYGSNSYEVTRGKRK